MSVFIADKNVYLIIFKLYDIKFKKYLKQKHVYLIIKQHLICENFL